MMALQEGSVGRGKTAFGKTGYWNIEDGLGQGCAAAAIRSKCTTSLIQRAVGRLCEGFEYEGQGEVGQTWFADDGAFYAENMAGLQLWFDVVWVVTRLAGLDLIVKPDGSKTAWSGTVYVGGVWQPITGWDVMLPNKQIVPQVNKYKHLGWVETVMIGRGGAWTEWKEDRERLEGRLRWLTWSFYPLHTPPSVGHDLMTNPLHRQSMEGSIFAPFGGHAVWALHHWQLVRAPVSAR